MGLLVALFSLPSCLKNGNYFVDFASAGASVDLPFGRDQCKWSGCLYV